MAKELSCFTIIENPTCVLSHLFTAICSLVHYILIVDFFNSGNRPPQKFFPRGEIGKSLLSGLGTTRLQID